MSDTRPSGAGLRPAGPARAGDAVSTRPPIDKLGVMPGARVALVGVDDPDVLARLTDRTDNITIGDPLPETDLVLCAADLEEGLDVPASLRTRIRPGGVIRVVSRKGKAATLRDVDLIAAARTHDLVDNKVVAFSPTHTALRLVIPRSLRPTHERPA